jgi:hypothetical protein
MPTTTMTWTMKACAFATAMVVFSHCAWLMEPRTKGAPSTPQDTGLLIILDVSGSMLGDKLERARNAVRSVAAGLPRGSVVGLRTFSSQTNLLVPPGTAGLDQIPGVLPGLRADGGTNIADALLAAGDDARAASGGAARPWKLVLVSDGEGDSPARDIEAARRLASSHPEVTAHTIGIELTNRGRDELWQIASILRGSSWIVDRNQLEATLREAVSLAGFSSQGHSARPDHDTVGLAVLVLLAVGLSLSSGRLQRLSEARFTLVASAGAGAVAWMATQALLPASGTSSALMALVQNASYFMLAGLVFGVALAAAEGVYLGEPRRAAEQASLALPVGVFGGAAAGALGQLLYAVLQGAGAYGTFVRYISRALGWAVAGAIVGACPGVAARSRTRIFNGALGGAAGGVAGGWFFELMALHAGGGARLGALMVLGAAIGFMVRVVEAARKKAWLVLLEGGPEGKEFIVAKPITTLGSHYKDDVCVAGDRGHPMREALIRREESGYFLEPVPGGRARMNDAEVRGSVRLRHGSTIRVGAGELVFQLRDAAGEDMEHTRSLPTLLPVSRSAPTAPAPAAVRGPAGGREPGEADRVSASRDADGGPDEGGGGINFGPVHNGPGRIVRPG